MTGNLMREQVEAALERIRPVLKADGSDVQLVDVTAGGVARLRFLGGCQGCVMSNMTLKNGVERTILQEVPGVTAVESV